MRDGTPGVDPGAKRPVPLLDKGTHREQVQVRGLEKLRKAPIRVNVWPTCGEAVIVFSSGERKTYSEGEVPMVTTEDENRARSDRRARSALRRYHAHNDLSEMFSLTYAELLGVDDIPKVSEHLHRFFLRFRRFAGESAGPYSVVPEIGHKTGHLHLHVGTSWATRFGAVEVCERCATSALLEKRPDVPPVGSFCIACLWGRGFVGRPTLGGDPASLSRYLSKYLGKDFGEGHVFPHQARYRIAPGFKPEPVRLGAQSRSEAIQMALEGLLDPGDSYSWWTSEGEENWTGPVVLMLYKDGPLTDVEPGQEAR